MRKLVYYIAVSIDGYIAGPRGENDFYPHGDDMAVWMTEQYPETVPTHVRTAVGLGDLPNKTFDTVVMGRGTYQAAGAGVISPYAHLKSYVVSATLGPIDDPTIEVYDGDPVELVRKLKVEDGLNIYLCGGGHLAGALISEIDELVIKSYPIVARDGISAFTGAFNPTNFTPTDHKSFSNGAYVTWYKRS